jgi:GTP cyclohydrolase I
MYQPTDTELADTQNLKDTRGIDIDRVGVKGLRVPLHVAQRCGGSQHTVATAALTVDLPRHFKGTHMSRFVEVLGADTQGEALSPTSLPRLLKRLKKRLESNCAHVDLEFPFFMKKAAPATGAKGLMDYTVRFNATADQSTEDLVTTVIVNVTTLCPCSKAISRHGAHNQRGQVTFSIRTRKLVWFEEMIDLVERSASSELYSLLKRPDEKVVTERAYENPVFVEDLVRNIALRANQDERITWYQVEAENFESIHNHNAYAMIEKRREA